MEYGDVDYIKIIPYSSGKFKIEIVTKERNFPNTVAFIQKIMAMIRAPRSVES